MGALANSINQGNPEACFAILGSLFISRPNLVPPRTCGVVQRENQEISLLDQEWQELRWRVVAGEDVMGLWRQLVCRLQKTMLRVSYIKQIES